MFSRPKGGWVDITIGNYIIQGSYLTDIPMNFLDSLICSLENNTPVSVFIDEEGVEDIICAYYNEIFIIVKDEDNVEYKKVNIDFNKFRRNIINGIENYFDEWVNWNMCDNNKILKNRKIELEEKINKAKELLKDMI